MTTGPLARYVKFRCAGDDRLSFRELARRIDVDPVAFTQWRAGKRSLPARCLPALDREIAAGKRPGNGDPVYIVSVVGISGATAPMRDAQGRLAYFDGAGAQLARDLLSSLRKAGLQDVDVIPTWPSELPPADERVWIDEAMHTAHRDSADPIGVAADEIATRFLIFLGSAFAAGDRNAGLRKTKAAPDPGAALPVRASSLNES